MSSNDIINLLPPPIINQADYEKFKKEHPYNILLKYAEAIDARYPGKLFGKVIDSTNVTEKKLLNYAFYILAAIGNGYSYRFLELEPTTTEMYPLKIIIFEKYPQLLNEVNGAAELENELSRVFSMPFTKTLLSNLLMQVNLYNETRKYRLPDDIKSSDII